ncbi:hypothetical protein ABI59_00635 [Acidobacteria bacterium Mor1]|nr:hypothetical protein ABI59_00635 [Acidobacteria bacterium Mor1]
MSQIATGLTNAAKSFGKVRAVDDVTLELRPGQVLGLLGPNGAGKTTSIKLLLGLLQPDRGRARLFGVDPRSREARMRIGVMMQIGEVPAVLTIDELVEQFRGYYPNPRPAGEAIELAGLGALRDRRAGKLSGGEKQRLMFALAICGNPELLFLDEPTVGMDVASRRTFWEGIRAFLDGGRSILLTTHYLEEADALADRIAVIDRGRVIADGTPETIKSRFSGKRIRCRTSLSPTTLLGLPGVRETGGSGASVELISETPERTVRALLDADAGLSDLEVIGMGLEEAFLSMTESPAGTEEMSA